MLRQALAGRDKDVVLKPPRESWVSAHVRPEVLEVYEGSYMHRMPPEITGGGHIVQALEAALWAFHRGETRKHLFLRGCHGMSPDPRKAARAPSTR